MLPQQKLKIAHVVLSLDMGGLEKIVSLMAQYQHHCGHKVSIICLDRIGALGEEIKHLNIDIQCLNRLPGRLDIAVLLQLIQFLRQNQFNIVHSHNVEAYTYAAVAILTSHGARLIHTQHGLPDQFKPVKKLFLRISGSWLGRHISVSRQVQQQAINSGWTNENKADMITNGIDTSLYVKNERKRKILRDHYNISENEIVLIAISRIEPVKDHVTLIRQYSNLCASMNNTRLLIIGDGSLKPAIESMIYELGLVDRVTCLGQQSDIIGFLQMADVYMLTSISEGISISLLEAMSAELIPIVTPVGGNTQIVDGKTNGFYLDINNPDSLLRLISTLYSIKNKPALISSAARDNICCNFDLTMMMNRYSNHYYSLL